MATGSQVFKELVNYDPLHRIITSGFHVWSDRDCYVEGDGMSEQYRSWMPEKYVAEYHRLLITKNELLKCYRDKCAAHDTLLAENEKLKDQVAVLEYRSPTELMKDRARLLGENRAMRAALETISKSPAWKSFTTSGDPTFHTYAFSTVRVAEECLEGMK